MCGFVALLNGAGDSAERQAQLGRMLHSIAHRGPDDSGQLVDGPVALGFRRLSILDLSPAGHQPMDSADGACTIVFNGEIYNYLELRAELQGLGHVFRSTGDTDVLLAAYREWGPAMLPRLNGMWAFVILDRARQCLFGSRDRFGIKPLYRFQKGRQFVLASEVKAIRASGLHNGAPDLATCAAYLHQGRIDDSDATFYDGVRQVGAGHAFEIGFDGSYREWPFWRLGDTAETEHADPAGAFAAMFEDAMRLHMRSDVPVGVNLSGGLDSTSIICAAARINAAAGASTGLLAFCFQDRQFDESRYIADTLRQTGARLVPLEMTPLQLWQSLPAVLAAQDEPVHSMTALVGYHLMGLARSHGVKVVLNGQGADETIAGYGNYFPERWADLVRAGQPEAARAEIDAYTQAHGGDAAARLKAAQGARLRSRLAGSAPQRWLAGRRRKAEAADRGWLRPHLAELLAPASAAPVGLREALEHSVLRQPLPLYLRVEDRNSMAHSIEVRVPFLDHRLVELVHSLQSRWKISGPWNKHVLREGMRGLIPESVRSRVDKMGFPTNFATWLKGPLHDEVTQVLEDPSFQRSELFDPQAVAQDLQAHAAGRANHADRIFDAVQLHLWLNQTR